jgi:hypothetical protein
LGFTDTDPEPDGLEPTVRVYAAGGVFTVRLTDRVVFPLLLVVLVKVTVSLYVPALRLLAVLFIEAVTVAVAPAARLPLVEESVTQLRVLEAVQLMVLPPVFWRV